MAQATSRINDRIAWCRKQSVLAPTEPELDGWRAEEEGLRDAVMGRDHTNDYSLCIPEVFERYVRGFQEGTVLLRAARAERIIDVITAGIAHQSPSEEQDILL
jgi:hypothetical protein